MPSASFTVKELTFVVERLVAAVFKATEPEANPTVRFVEVSVPPVLVMV